MPSMPHIDYSDKDKNAFYGNCDVPALMTMDRVLMDGKELRQGSHGGNCNVQKDVGGHVIM